MAGHHLQIDPQVVDLQQPSRALPPTLVNKYELVKFLSSSNPRHIILLTAELRILTLLVRASQATHRDMANLILNLKYNKFLCRPGLHGVRSMLPEVRIQGHRLQIQLSRKI